MYSSFVNIYTYNHTCAITLASVLCVSLFPSLMLLDYPSFDMYYATLYYSVMCCTVHCVVWFGWNAIAGNSLFIKWRRNIFLSGFSMSTVLNQPFTMQNMLCLCWSSATYPCILVRAFKFLCIYQEINCSRIYSTYSVRTPFLLW